MKLTPPLQRAARRPSLKRTLTVTAVAGALVLTAACSSSSKSSAGGSGTTSAAASSPSGSAAGDSGVISSDSQAELTKFEQAITDYPTITPVKGASAALKGKTVWIVPVAAALAYFQGLDQGATEALTALGAKVHVCDAKYLPTGVASCLTSAAQQGAAGVISLYNDYSLVPNAFDALVAKHIPVLIAGEPASGGKTDSPALAFYNDLDTQESLQRLLAASIIKDSGGKAKVLFIGERDSTDVSKEADYTTAYYKQNCPGCKVNEIDFLAASATKLPSLVSAALISHPDVNYVHLMLDPFTSLVLGAVQSSGKANSIKLATEGGGLDSLQRVAQGKQFLDAGISGVYGGWTFTDGLVRMMTGSTPVVRPISIRLFNKENVAGLDLTPAGYASNKWYGDDSYQQGFKSAWGIS